MANSRTGGAFGYLKKSIGSVTYSTMRDGSGKRIQVVRSKPTEVTNPNTVAQILQRMKVKPAARFYNALAEILSNSFEGVNYGTDSRREFMKLAMSQNGPYVPKSATRFIPAKYPVSRGSIAEVGGLAYDVEGSMSSPAYNNKGFYYNINGAGFDAASDAPATIASTAYGHDVQFTFIAVTQNADGSFAVGYNRILSSVLTREYISTGSNRYLLLSNNAMVRFDEADNANIIDFYAGTDIPAQSSALAPRFEQVVAAAVIVSYREGDAWVRTSADMIINPALDINLYGTEARTVAIESYQSFASVNELNNAWYLNLANGQQYPGRLALQNVTMQFEVEEGGETVIVERELIVPYGTQIDAEGRTRTEVFADASGNAIFNVNGLYQTVDEPGTTPATPIRWADVLVSTPFYGSRVVTWKEAYSIQIG